MKFAKYLLTLAVALCAFAGITKAQNGTLQFLGAGSSALFQETGAASQAIPGVSCLWSYGKTASGGTPYIAANDGRSGINLDENGPIWIAWGPGSTGTCASPSLPFNIYAYISLDSVVGDRCFFSVDTSNVPGCTLKLQSTGSIVGANQITTTPDSGVALPSTVVGALAGAHVTAAGTDIRPEDAKFAIIRAFTPCNQLIARQYFNNDSYYLSGWGYGTSGSNLGTAVQGYSTYGGGSFNVVNFNITGNDPISGNAVPSYTVSAVGAQPIIVAISPIGDGQIAGISDVPASTLSLFYQGLLGRTTDFLLSSAATGSAEAITVLVREPLSGTYNTFEYGIPQSTQFHAGQEYNNCSGTGPASNPMYIQNGGGVFGNASVRARVIGTGGMTGALQGATSDVRLGYFFWSEGNVGVGTPSKYLTKVKYLKVNGIDPLLDQNAAGYSYTGVFPGLPGGAPVANVNFAGVNAGNYPIWSALRLVGKPSDAGVAALISALHTLDASQNDYIALNSLNVWHSHFFINGENIATPANGATVGTTTLCSGGAAEAGGDVGGSILLIANNAHFCSDLGSTQGILNKTY